MEKNVNNWLKLEPLELDSIKKRRRMTFEEAMEHISKIMIIFLISQFFLNETQYFQPNRIWQIQLLCHFAGGTNYNGEFHGSVWH